MKLSAHISSEEGDNYQDLRVDEDCPISRWVSEHPVLGEGEGEGDSAK
jgi:hypothetical protein